MPDIVKLRQLRAQKIDELNTDAVVGDSSRFSEIETEIADLDGQIDRATRAETRAASLARPLTNDCAAEPDLVRNGEIMRGLSGLGRNANLREVREVLGFQPGEAHFHSFGEYLAAVAGHYRSHGSQTDARLARAGIDQTMTRAPSGAGTIDPTGGGFLVQTDFANMVFTRAYAMGEILSRVTRFSISTGANGIKIPGIDETSRATGSRYGGVQSYWLAEGDALTASKPKFRLIELDLKKLASRSHPCRPRMFLAPGPRPSRRQRFTLMRMWHWAAVISCKPVTAPVTPPERPSLKRSWCSNWTRPTPSTCSTITPPSPPKPGPAMPPTSPRRNCSSMALTRALAVLAWIDN